MNSRCKAGRPDVALQALLMAVWRRKPKGNVLIHSDQGSQFTSMDWAAFLHAHNLEHSMSRRGNCHDNAGAESFFNLLKREPIRRRTSQPTGYEDTTMSAPISIGGIPPDQGN